MCGRVAHVSTPPPPTTEQVAAVVGKLIRQRGLSDSETARRSHVPRQTLERKLAAPRPFTVSELAGLATALGTTASAILSEAEAAA